MIPTPRFGVENSASYAVTDKLRLKGGVTYMCATFRQGIYAGNDVPLVSPWTGKVGVSADLYQNIFVFDAALRYVRRSPHG